MKRIVKKPEERRLEIIKASRQLFLKKDYESTTIQDVMDKLKIAKGTTYHYFKSKAELLDAVVQDIVDEYLQKVNKAVAESQGNALEKMRVLFAAGRMKGEDFKALRALHRPGNSLMHTQLLAVTVSKLAPMYADLISQGCQEGLFKTDFPLESAEFILSAVSFLTDIGIYPWTQNVLTRRINAFPKIIEQLLKAPKGSFEYLSEMKEILK